MEKVPVGILGTGNIGSDLLMKTLRSEHIRCGIFAGRDQQSEGIAKARKLGVPVSHDSVYAIEKDPDCCEIVLDATNADAHLESIKILRKLGKCVIDLTPSKMGWMCVPALNLPECTEKKEISLVTCGGQSSIPIAHEIMEVFPEVGYIEVATSISSKSAGPGTRINLDEYVQTTQKGIEYFTGVKKAKAIININPAVPPINMHNTIYAEIDGHGSMDRLEKLVREMAKSIQAYVPGYRLEIGPVYENQRITTIIEVVGLGDYLPKYAGNLDIMTCAAIAVAEEYAKNIRK